MTFFSDDEVACIAGRARVLCDPTRVRILDALARGDYTAGRLAAMLAIDEWTLSGHLEVLFSAGLVQRRDAGAAAPVYALESGELIDVCHLLGRRAVRRAERTDRRVALSGDRRRTNA